jgi:tellurite resistance protein TehA-like permease
VLSGLSVLLWAFGTWIIPLLVAFGVWRHLILHVPLRYEPALWSICFPLGMYSVASSELGGSAKLPLVAAIGKGWAWVALAAWVVVFAAMLVSLVRATHRVRAGALSQAVAQ